MVRIDAAADASFAAMRARSRFGIAIAAIIRMIATTISNSISEKPFCLCICSDPPAEVPRSHETIHPVALEIPAFRQVTTVPSHFNPKIPKESFALAVLEKRVLWYTQKSGVSKFVNVDLCIIKQKAAFQFSRCFGFIRVFFFSKQKTAYEITR